MVFVVKRKEISLTKRENKKFRFYYVRGKIKFFEFMIVFCVKSKRVSVQSMQTQV